MMKFTENHKNIIWPFWWGLLDFRMVYHPERNFVLTLWKYCVLLIKYQKKSIHGWLFNTNMIFIRTLKFTYSSSVWLHLLEKFIPNIVIKSTHAIGYYFGVCQCRSVTLLQIHSLDHLICADVKWIYSRDLIINGTETRTKTHSVLGLYVRVQRIIINKFEVIPTVALLCFTLVELKPNNLLIVILATTSNHPIWVSIVRHQT